MDTMTAGACDDEDTCEPDQHGDDPLDANPLSEQRSRDQGDDQGRGEADGGELRQRKVAKGREGAERRNYEAARSSPCVSARLAQAPSDQADGSEPLGLPMHGGAPAT